MIRVRRLLLLFIIMLPLMLTGAYVIFPLAPMGGTTNAYEKKFDVSGRYPFLLKYYLLKPQGYNPNQKYPLVLVLHGADRTSYPGHVVSTAALRQRHPAFVLVPIAPIKFFWDTPYAEAKMGEWFPALPHAVSLMKKVQSSYAVDPARTYVIGNSMGGFGAFGALVKYPDTFAAGVPACGGWSPADANRLAGKSIWAFHGARDDAIPVNYTRDVMARLPKIEGKIQYTEYPNAGHGCQMEAFRTYQVWDWLFSQRL